jgi:cytidylate kinase
MQRPDLRSPEADAAATTVAAFPAVRAALLDFQRNYGRSTGAVLDGRDIGTVVFPEAQVKLFVTASLESRARRRWQELRQRGVEAELAEVESDMRRRDQQDAARAVAPLRPAEDAILLDTTDLNPDQAFERAIRVIRARLGETGPG